MYNKMKSAPFRRSLLLSRGLLTSYQTAGKIETYNAVAPRIQSPPSFFKSGILDPRFSNLRSNPRDGKGLGYERTLHLLTSARRLTTSVASPSVERGRAQDPYLATEIALDAVVKIFAVSSSPNYFLPWQNKAQREATGSGECPKV